MDVLFTWRTCHLLLLAAVTPLLILVEIIEVIGVFSTACLMLVLHQPLVKVYTQQWMNPVLLEVGTK